MEVCRHCGAGIDELSTASCIALVWGAATQPGPDQVRGVVDGRCHAYDNMLRCILPPLHDGQHDYGYGHEPIPSDHAELERWLAS